MSEPGWVTTRRTTLALALAGPFIVAGCDLDPPQSEPSPSPTPTAPAVPDADLLDEVHLAIVSTVAFLSATTARHPALAGANDRWQAVHRSHLDALELDTAREVAAADVRRVPARRGRAATEVDAAEAELSTALRDAAGLASSGDLARALASMGAGLYQRLRA